jgi:Tfp pilus assembly protein PilE
MAIGTPAPQGDCCRLQQASGIFYRPHGVFYCPPPEATRMKSHKGITLVELVVILCIASIFVAVAVPKFITAVTKNKMWDGMTTLMTFESAELAYLAQAGKLGPVDSIVFKADSSEYFSFSPACTGHFKAAAKVQIGRFKKGSWLHTSIDTTGGVPRIRRSCSPGDSAIVKRYISMFFN